jgi:hypothetical protein
MKMKALFAAFITIMLFALMSCKTGPKDMLTKKWKATDVSAPGITPEQKTKFLQNNLTLEFTKDGKYNATMSGNPDDKGTYTLSEDGKTITMVSQNEGSNPLPVKELTKEKLVTNIMGADVTFVPNK